MIDSKRSPSPGRELAALGRAAGPSPLPRVTVTGPPREADAPAERPAAAALTAISHFVRGRIGDPVAVAAAAFAAVVSTILLLHSAGAPIEYWFGGWRPRHGVALGIAFSIDPFGA